MKKTNNIRGKAVKDSLESYNALAQTLKENTEDAVKNILSETVRDTYAKILAEEEDDEYDKEEVEDTDALTSNDDETDSDDILKSDDDTEDSVEAKDEDGNDETVDVTVTPDGDGAEVEKTIDGEDSDGDEWTSFEKYKVGDDEYDFSDANDDEIVKVYKLLKDDDQVMVNKEEDNKVSIKDNENDTEYLIDLGGSKELNDDCNMNESDETLYELALNEYDSNVGYTDNYQKNDVLDTKGLSVADDKDSKDWGSAGLKSRGNEKPWSGKKNVKAENQPFDNSSNEETIFEVYADDIEEATNVGGFVQQNSTSKSHVPNSSGRKARNSGKGTVVPRYSAESEAKETNEKLIRKANKIFNENKELKKALLKFKKVLQEAAITNVNLGQIIKLISENTTSQDEKKEIIARFGKEAKTIEQSKNLYENISKSLRKANKMNITESANISATNSKQINETPIYRSSDLLESLDLMHRLSRV